MQRKNVFIFLSLCFGTDEVVLGPVNEEQSLPQFLHWYRACPTSGFTGFKSRDVGR